jgi:hypothetical protein
MVSDGHGVRVSNAYVTYPLLGDNQAKAWIIPHKAGVPGGTIAKATAVADGHASD